LSKLHRHLSIAVLLSEFSHVFCCVLPTVFTVLSFAVNLGLITVMPGFLLDLHKHIHEYEAPIIVVSGGMLILGWACHAGSRRVDCHDDGCGHPPCDPQKNTNARILTIATILFVMNLSIYFFIHKNILELSAFTSQNALAYTAHHN
jgi:hypothetical protein